MRDAQAEARERLGGRYDVRVLEPSPPAVVDGSFFADDPAVLGERATDLPVVSPTGDGDLRWDDVCDGDAALVEFAADRWLGCHHHLLPLPSSFVDSRAALHRVAAHVVAPARRAVNGKFGLRFTYRGFGTPFFGDDVQVRVEGVELVVERRDATARLPLTTLAAGAGATGVAVDEDAWRDLHDIPPVGDVDEPLAVDPAGAGALGEWFGFAASVLEQLRFELRATAEPSRVQLWPEHFDIAFDDGRANFGCSPGDSFEPDPYVYVGPWSPEARPGDAAYWNAPFGAVLGYRDLLDRDDQRAAALEFLHEGAARLRPG